MVRKQHQQILKQQFFVVAQHDLQGRLKLGYRCTYLQYTVAYDNMGDGHLSEKINLHCGHLSDISGHLSDTISIGPKIYVDN